MLESNGLDSEETFIDACKIALYDGLELPYCAGCIWGNELKENIKLYLMNKYNYTEKQLEDYVKGYRDRIEKEFQSSNFNWSSSYVSLSSLRDPIINCCSYDRNWFMKNIINRPLLLKLKRLKKRRLK